MTREEYLEEFVPKYSVWASKAGVADIKEPTNARILQGWGIEKPAHHLFNWHMNRTDKRLNELEARVSWLEEQALKS